MQMAYHTLVVLLHHMRPKPRPSNRSSSNKPLSYSNKGSCCSLSYSKVVIPSHPAINRPLQLLTRQRQSINHSSSTNSTELVRRDLFSRMAAWQLPMRHLSSPL
mmetsp:Transcript_33644/g.74498  ORF Transcript_33644/g.74498 Transcript_33644/m.74498 type:complete len:104 (+) Transcript_33644:2356-2667(+)